MKNPLLVLTVIRDDETRSCARNILQNAGHKVVQSADHLRGQLLIDNGLEPDLVLVEAASDQPLSTLARLQQLGDTFRTRICLITGNADEKLRADARNLGIQHFLVKPATDHAIESMIESMNPPVANGAVNRPTPPPAHTKTTALQSTSHPSPVLVEELSGDRYFLAASPRMLEIYRQIKLIAEFNVPVLILGETGTGKEVIAHLIHKLSQRSRERFLNLNCAALPSELVESELFGHRQGAFTGALKDQLGMVEKANRGTLLLDEIGEMSVQMQAKLLHVIQDGQFTRLGGQESTKVDVRILAATNIDMDSALAEKTFREDLYYRLNTFNINVPPLRERQKEIPYLIDETIRRSTYISNKCGTIKFSSRLLDAALAYSWPGNLRELRNFVTRAIVMGDEDKARQELEAKIAATNSDAGPYRSRSTPHHQPAMRSLVRDIKNRTEVQMIQDALERSGWNRRRAAEVLNISYRGLLYKIHQHQLIPNR